MRFPVQVFHIILDPLLLWADTDFPAQFGSEAVDEGAPAQLDRTLGALPKRWQPPSRRKEGYGKKWPLEEVAAFATLGEAGLAPTKATARV